MTECVFWVTLLKTKKLSEKLTRSRVGFVRWVIEQVGHRKCEKDVLSFF